MGSFLAYSICSGFYMLCLYLAYRVFQAKEKQHAFNRAVLLAIYPISFVALPLIARWINADFGTSGQAKVLTGVATAIVPDSSGHEPLWGTILLWIFLVGMIVTGVRTLLTWIRLCKVIRTGTKIRRLGYTLVVTDDEKYAPFSWLRYVVISKRDFEENSTVIINHECEHIAAMHCLDLMVAQAVCIINWFNPAAWLMRDELMLVHEYQADSAVIENGHNPQEYQTLLIKKAVGSRFPSLTNSLNHSKLKKRITMMYKQKSGAGRKVKALALVPVLALAVGLTDVPPMQAAMSTISNCAISPDKGSEKAANSETKFRVVGINDSGEETTIVIRGTDLGSNLSVSGGKITTQGTRVTAKSLKSNMTDGSAMVSVVFPCTGMQQNSVLQLNINGTDVSFDLGDFFKNADSVDVADTAATYVLKLGKNDSAIPSDMTFIYNGKEISREEFNKIKPDQIASISIDKQKNTIVVTGK